MEFKTYSRRVGSDDLGKDYEYKITAILALRCAALPDTENMWVGSNLDHLGDFDDIGICRKTTNGKHYAYLIQLKHQQDPKSIAEKEFFSSSGKGKKDNFSLSKYHNSFLDIQSKIQSADDSSEIINYLKKCDKIVPILFTNKFAPKTDFLEPKLDDSLNFLKTNTEDCSIFTFNSSKCNFDSDFLENLVLFTNQAHVNDVDTLIEDSVKTLTGSGSNSKAIAQQFLKFITTWSKDKNSNVYYTLTKNDIINKLVSFALERFAMVFPKDVFIPSDCERIQIFNSIIESGTKFVFDFDEFVYHFLKSYLATEIKKHVNVDNKRRWSDHLSNEQQRLFLGKYLNSNTKTLEVGEKLGIFDVYQNLWLSNRIPLILSIKDNEHYEIIKTIFELSNCNLSLIIFKDRNIKLNENDIIGSLADLTSDIREQILCQNIELQGRAPICLKLLIGESLQEFLKLRDIVYILSDAYSTGRCFENLPDHFIEQNLSMVCLKHEVIANLADDLFLIQNHANFLAHEHPNAISFDEGDDLKPFQLSNKDTHRLEYHNDFYFVWRNTFGNIKKIRTYRDEEVTAFMFEEYSIAQLFPKSAWENYDIQFKNIYNPVHIVSADPGMGKSVLMNFIASQTNTDFWVLKLNLIEFEQHFLDLLKLSVEDQLALINQKLLEKGDCVNPEVAQKMFEIFLIKKQVLLLLDGFDEIAFLFKNEITDMAKKICKAGFFIWITTRPVMKTHLEDTFNTFSVTIKPFTSKDQELYLIQYFASVVDPGEKFNFLIEFVQELLRAARRNFYDEDYKFTGVPLQTRFMGEVFAKEYVASLTSGLINFNQTFDLLYLYEEFSKGKIDILCQKYDNNAKRSRILFKKYQQLYAVHLVFPELFTKNLNLETILTDYSANKTEEIQFLQREGVLVLDQYSADSKYKFNVKFVHLTFAEFLAAQWLSENINSTDESIRNNFKDLIEWRFHVMASNKFLFKMFDRILAKNCPLHLAVINNRWDKIDPKHANSLDRGGRSLLQLIALYGVPHPEIHRVIEPIVDNMVPLVDEINQNVEACDKVLSYNALDYALRIKSLAIANKICEKFQLSTVIKISSYDALNYFSYCITLNYRHLFHKLLNYLASRSILLEESDKTKPLRSFCKVYCDHPNFEDYLKEYGEKRTIGDLFKITDQESSYHDFRFAISFGETENVNNLLPNQNDLNDVDVDNNTPLYYAVRFQRLDHVKLLLSIGVDVNKNCQDGDTALHLAAKKGNLEIVNELLGNNANVNSLNNLQKTPIFHAVLFRRYEVVTKLEEEGAILNLEDKEGNNLLHLAAIIGSVDFLINYLVKYPISINKQNKNGDTPLLLATKNRNSECVSLLLSNGAVCNKENVAGDTPLHYACQEGFYQITQELISYKCDVNKQNKKKQNPLLVAIKCNQYELANLLLENRADCNVGDVDGYVPFHAAIQEGWADVAIKMMLLGADVNKCGRHKATPLHVATEHNYPVISKILIDFGAEVHSKDIFGTTPLHCAAQGGQNYIIEMLLERGADINCTNKFKFTPLLSALQYYKCETANLLLDANADWNTTDIMGYTPLMVAAERGLIHFVKYFIAQGISINHSSNCCQTALHLACQNGKLDTAQELINHAADVNSQTENGKTPLHLCIEDKIFRSSEFYENYVSVVTLLIENGADVNLQDNYGNSALHYVCFAKDKPFPLPKDTVEFIMEHFYNHVAILLLENNVNTDLRNVEKKTALDLAKEAEFTGLFKIIDDYEEIPEEEDIEDPDDEIRFLRRSGCESVGKEYEIKITALLAIKCAILQTTENMWIGGNVGHVGDFDDIVLCRTTSDGKYIAYLVQLKHQENPDNLTKQDFTYATASDEKKTKKYKKDFSLFKYYNSYVAIKKDIESNDVSSDIIYFLRKCETFYLILFTNKNGSNCNFLDQTSDHTLSFLDTAANPNIFKFNQEFLNFETNYLEHLVLLTNQTHLKGTDSLIESELKNFRPFSKLNVKAIGQEFISFVRNKMEHVPKENVKKLCTLNKSDVIHKLVAIALRPFMVDFFDEDYCFYDCPKKGIWNEIAQDKSVTLVDSDDFTAAFLKQYIGTLVRKYVHGQKAWNDLAILDKNFDTHMLTTEEEITLFDLYNCLWFTGVVPLLLQIKTTADYQTILKLLELTDDLKVIMLKPEILNVPKNGKVFYSLPDLSPNIILQQNVKLQGRPIVLKDVIGNAELKLIKSRDIIYILCDCFKIGYQYEVPDNYLEQGLSKILLDYSVRNDESSERLFHHMKVFDKFSFEWEKSIGGIDKIYKYKLDRVLGNTWNRYDLSNPINVVSANAGVGKTEFLNFIATQSNTNTWVLKINLKDYEEYYAGSDDESAINHIHYFNKSILETSNCTNKSLSRLIFQKFLDKKKILILLDGFDEISIYFKNEVTNLVKCFHDEGYPIWITTRPIMKTHLEKTFGTFGRTLQPLAQKDQENYLIRHFNAIDNSKNTELSCTFAKKVLLNYNRFPKFTENPLFLKFVADASVDIFKNCLRNGTCDFQFNYFVLEKFKDRMTDILRQKFGEDYARIETMLRKYQKLSALKFVFPDKHLKSLNIDETLADYFEHKREECGILQSEGIVTLNLCTLDANEKYKIGFVHPVFADLLAAQWLFENFASDNEATRRVAQNLYQTRFTNFNPNVFRILDGLLSKSYKSHINILADKMEEPSKDIENLDLGGRSVLHLIALCPTKFSFCRTLTPLESSVLENWGKSAQKIDKDKFNFSPLDYALKNCKLPLADYFCQHFNFSLGIPISKNWKQFYFSSCISLGLPNLFTKILRCTVSKALLMEDLSPTITTETFCDIPSENSCGILEKFKNQTLLDLFKDSSENQDFFDLRLAVSFGNIANVKQLLSENADLNEIDEFHNSLLYYASKFNRLEMVDFLLSMDADVNQCCENGNTAIHLVAKMGYFDLAVALLKCDANIEINNDFNQTPIFLAVKYKHLPLVNLLSQVNSVLSGNDALGNTLLHYSAENNWIELMTEFILSYPEFVNKENENHQTPLLIALENGNVEYAKLLLQNGVCVNSKDDNGNTALHVASKMGQNDILVELISSIDEIDLKNVNGETALLLAGIHGHAKTAELLIISGANCLSTDNFRNNFLYCAIKKGWTDCVKKLLGTINFRSIASNLLQLSILHNRVEIANELIDSIGNLDMRDEFGNTCLHYAALSSEISMLAKIMSKGMDLNMTNNFKRTAMHYASISSHEEVVRLLLSSGASWEKTDIYGKTPCDYAVELKFQNIIDLFKDKDTSSFLNKTQNVDGTVTFKLLMEPIIQNYKPCKPEEMKPLLDEEGFSLNKENLIATIFYEHIKP